MGKRMFIILLIPFLLYLFIVPGQYANSMAEDVQKSAARAMSSAYQEDWAAAFREMEQLNAKFQQYKTPLQLFLNHKDVTELESAIKSGLQLTRAQDKGQFLMETERAILLSDNLASIERLNIYGLL